MELNKTKTNKNVVELRQELMANGTTVENVYVDGQKFVCIGYVSERDKAACLKAIQAAVDGSENLWEAAQKLMINANLTDKQITPDEEVDVNGYPCLIDYDKRIICDHNGDTIADLEDLHCELPDEAIKTLLIERAATALAEEEDW